MTEHDAMKALECCKSHDVGTCKDCPVYEERGSDCVRIICEKAFDIINRKNAEIERLESVIKELAEESTNE